MPRRYTVALTRVVGGGAGSTCLRWLVVHDALQDTSISVCPIAETVRAYLYSGRCIIWAVHRRRRRGTAAPVVSAQSSPTKYLRCVPISPRSCACCSSPATPCAPLDLREHKTRQNRTRRASEPYSQTHAWAEPAPRREGAYRASLALVRFQKSVWSAGEMTRLQSGRAEAREWNRGEEAMRGVGDGDWECILSCLYTW